MNFLFLTLVLALGWAVATGSFTVPALLFGAAIAGLALFVIRDRVERPGLLRRAARLLSLGGFFLKELLVSAVRVAILVARPDMHRHLSPGIVAYPLTVTRDADIALLANLVTLTPGTLTIDVSDDRRFLYVHAISFADREALIAEIATGFEARILELHR